MYLGGVGAIDSPVGDLIEHRALIAACLRHRVPFFWRGPGTMLIASPGIEAVFAEVTSQGFEILGIEGFKVDPAVRPQLDMIVDNTAGHPHRDPATTARSWGDDIWIDVALAPRGSSAR
jgi:hypothetical protein